jgi:peptide/nickel transport system ATP-binding protein
VKPLLEVRGLRVEAGPLSLVRDVDLDLARGETLCIAGESGSGKSLTALALMDLLGPGLRRRAEAARFDGIDLLSTRATSRLRGSRMAMIFQEPMTALNPVFTIGSQLEAVYRRHPGRARSSSGRGAAAARRRAGSGSFRTSCRGA